MISCNCPTCGKSFSLRDEHAGRRGKCSCGAVFHVPGGGSARQAVSAGDASPEPSARLAAPISRSHPPRKITRWKIVLVAILGAFIGLALGEGVAFGGMWVLLGDPEPRGGPPWYVLVPMLLVMLGGAGAGAILTLRGWIGNDYEPRRVSGGENTGDESRTETRENKLQANDRTLWSKLKCMPGFHEWDGCSCLICGKTRHGWSQDHEGCVRCGWMIEIATLEELQAINNDLAGHYRLVADIDACETKQWNRGCGFTSIGSQSADGFVGVFDGNGRVISHLHIDRPQETNVGVFANNCGAIMNVRLDDVTIAGKENVGGVVGVNNGTMTECSASGMVSGRHTVGGLVGVNRHNIIACSASADVSGEGVGVGGLVGTNGEIEEDGPQGGATVARCSTSGIVSGHTYVGGLVGVNFSSTISESSASGDVSGQDRIGGLVGWNTVMSEVSRCAASAAVFGRNSIGGLVGHNQIRSTVTESLAWGDVDGDNSVGGLVGSNSEDGMVSESYWSIEASGQHMSDGGLARSSGAMMRRSTYVGWDFENVWQIDEGTSYPTLRCLAGNRPGVKA